MKSFIRHSVILGVLVHLLFFGWVAFLYCVPRDTANHIVKASLWVFYPQLFIALNKCHAFTDASSPFRPYLTNLVAMLLSFPFSVLYGAVLLLGYRSIRMFGGSALAPKHKNA